ncbi:MAG: ExeM/NucH family extracellular endonuclease [Leptolyngbya sp. SIO3F4]|nr:ExeM/NucH family extracellular endonuclease [Leptolyngbya sp. SIO3F4]
MATVFINEFHYDNDGADTGEFIEIAGPAGTDLTDWSLVLYNGNGGIVYNTINLAGTISDNSNGFGFVVSNLPSNGLQNGSPDGIALVDNNGAVVEFISYEGSFVATDGPAAGQTSTDIGVSESSSTPIGDSLQRTGTGADSADFSWAAAAANTSGSANTGQTFTGGTTPDNVFISEIHYDNAGTDAGEFIEVTGDAGVDLTGYSLVLYNGSNGEPYGNTINLTGTFADELNGLGAIAVDFPSNGIQNGGPDGVALIAPDNSVVEFLSYEGTFTAVGGPADGIESTDIGVSESSSTAVGESLQLIDNTWTGPAAATKGDVNVAAPSNPNPANAFISEFHYDNAGGDVGEFIEVTADANADVTGYSLVLYNGSNGTAYDTISLSGIVANQSNGLGTVVIDFPVNGIQNGAPDGIALVDADNNVVEFISYEGSFTAVGGAADGLTSTDIGVSETSNTAIGDSLQLIDGVWTGPAPETKGEVNSDNGGGNGGGGGTGQETTIYEIQGSGTTSGKVGETVIVEGIVTGDFQDDGDDSNNLRGFYVQDENGDGDANTSDGIFVFESSLLTNVNEGDKVRVTGTVGEFFGETQITASGVEIVGSGSVSAVNIDLPAVNVITNSDGELIADLEQYEGMLITFNDTLTVDEYFNYDRFGEIRLSEGGRPFQFTQTNDPSIAGFQAHLEDLARRTITLDDGQTIQNPDPLEFPAPGFSDSNNFRGGDTVTGLTGNVRFSRGSGGSGDETYRIVTTEDPTFISQNSRPNGPENVGGSLKVVSFNVLNYFTTLDDGSTTANGSDPRGADNQTEFERQTQKLVTTILELDADVLGLVELENDFLPGSSGNAVENLVNELNAVAGAGTYDWVNPGQQFVDTGDAISVGAIYKTASVEITAGTNPATLTDSNLPTGFAGETIFDGVSTNRAPLAVSFTEKATGEQLTVAVNHFKSKGSIFPDGNNADIGDGQGNNNPIRLRAAQAVDAWLQTDPTGSGDPDFLILGDLNAYANEDPITYLEGAGYTDLAEAFSSGSTPYSFLFDGQLGTLDYGLANATLVSQVTGATEWHVNADEADALDYNLDFGRNPSLFNGNNEFRNSDHDPLIIGLNLESVSPATLAIEPTDAVKAEGDAGTTAFTFTVTRSGDTSEATNVDFGVTGVADAADFGGSLPSGTVSFAVGETTQTITVDVSGDTDIEADENFTVTLSNPTGDATITTAAADGTIQNDDIFTEPDPVLWFSTDRDSSTGQAEDIVLFDSDGNFTTVFDGSDVGLKRANIDAFDITGSEILLSFNKGLFLDGVGYVNDSDIVKFNATSLGSYTAGTFELFVDGSDIGLTTWFEDIDALTRVDEDTLLISTNGYSRLTGGVTARDEDLIQLDLTSTGKNTQGTASLYLDGSDIGLSRWSEDIDAVGVFQDQILLSTEGNFSVSGLSGRDEDVFGFTPSSIGSTTAGKFDDELFFDGSSNGFRGDIVAIDLSNV